jgi:DtxR family Mn-dependent transcriptional regulator
VPSVPASAAEQDYLREIYLLLEESHTATNQLLADRLGVKPPSVTAMIKRLRDRDDGPLVRHTPYRGVELTERGRVVALEMLRHHRLVELLLAELLGVPWDRVHEEADRLEHALSEDLEDRISEWLGHPEFDPHGDPIPTRDGTIPERRVRRLDQLPEGAVATVAQVTAQQAPVLQYLAGLGIRPGARLRVDSIAPFGGVVSVTILDADGAKSQAIGESLTARILFAESPDTGDGAAEP